MHDAAHSCKEDGIEERMTALVAMIETIRDGIAAETQLAPPEHELARVQKYGKECDAVELCSKGDRRSGNKAGRYQ